MIKVAFVDDSKEQQKIYENFMAEFQKEFCYDFSIEKFYDGGKIIFDYKSNYDIIYLDIEMESVNGIETANYIRKVDKNVIIIFVTNMSQYAIKGYAVNALDYLLKPVTYFAFRKILLDSIEIVKSQRTSFLMINTGDSIFKVDTATIVYLESIKHKIKIVTHEKEYYMTATIKGIEDDFKNLKNFYRSNNCYIVNMKYVTSVKGDMVCLGKHELLISKRRKKAFMTALTDYIGGSL